VRDSEGAGTTVEERYATFDAVAEDYDRKFTHTPLGRELRARVWQRLAARFPVGSRVLELNCGTGEDAAWLAAHGVEVIATDASPAMLTVTKRKTAKLAVEVMQIDLARPQADFPPASLDGAFSNFGGLNCVDDLHPLAHALSVWLKSGATLILVVMGPLCPWEILWHLLRGQPHTAFRRWTRGGAEARIGERRLQVYYPWPGDIRRVFAPEFRAVGIMGLGVMLPPSYIRHLVERWPQTFEWLARLERRLAAHFPATVLNDHYVLELERVTDGILARQPPIGSRG
jgi:SAM-dependent methyltransferase